jgi:hypothetical protein
MFIIYKILRSKKLSNTKITISDIYYTKSLIAEYTWVLFDF